MSVSQHVTCYRTSEDLGLVDGCYTDLAAADNYEMGARRMTATRGAMPTTPAAE